MSSAPTPVRTDPVPSAVPRRSAAGRGITIGGRTFTLGFPLTMIWLYFLRYAFARAFALDPAPARFAAVVVLVAFCVLYGWTFLRTRFALPTDVDPWVRQAAAPVGLGVFLTVAACLLIGEEGLTITVYLAVMMIMLVPGRRALVGVGLVIGASQICTLLIDGWSASSGLFISTVLASVAVWGVMQMALRNRQLAQAQEEIAQLAVAAERTRFARDLHDLLGHSLTVITLKSELAGRLVRLSPERAEQEIAEVERLARDALADVRAAVAGYREITLATELVSARTALEAAGITAELPTALDEVPGERRELLGWAVREGVTNVVRHSGASCCRIVLGADAVEIVDDGCGPPESGSSGNGLRGLRERARAAGATVSVGRVPDGSGFRLRVGW